MYIFSFEKLEVWIEAKDFYKNIYAITLKFPDTNLMHFEITKSTNQKKPNNHIHK